jgi:integrase
MRRRVAWIHGDQAKAGKPIGIPLADDAMAILARQRGQNKQWVFPWKGHPIGKIKTAWRRALERAKIEGFTWHGLRHTWASWHVQNGTPLAVLKELGGWASLSMVSRYAHLAPEHLRAYAGNANPKLRHKLTPQRARKAA